MAAIVLEVKNRDKHGTSSARSDRRTGFIPCIIYGDKKSAESICIHVDLLNKYLNKSNFFSTVFEMKGVGKDGQKFVAKDVQFHPVTDRPLHVDFMRVGKGSRIVVRISLKFINESNSPGLKFGGVLNILVHEIDVVCDPENIPEKIEIDLTGFEFHHTVHAHDIKLPSGVNLPANCKNFTIATVVAPTIMKKESETERASVSSDAATETQASSAS